MYNYDKMEKNCFTIKSKFIYRYMHYNYRFIFIKIKSNIILIIKTLNIYLKYYIKIKNYS